MTQTKIEIPPGIDPMIARLVEWRVQRGLSQREIAAKMGVGQPMVAKIEVGRDIRLSTLLKYAKALDINVTLSDKYGTPLIF